MKIVVYVGLDASGRCGRDARCLAMLAEPGGSTGPVGCVVTLRRVCVFFMIKVSARSVSLLGIECRPA
jgi:hypothetical protein